MTSTGNGIVLKHGAYLDLPKGQRPGFRPVCPATVSALRMPLWQPALSQVSNCRADGELRPFCTDLITSLGQTDVNAPASVLGGTYSQVPGGVSLMDQCLAEQRYVRGSQLRTLIYNQVGWLSTGPRIDDTLGCVVSEQDWQNDPACFGGSCGS